MRTRSDSFPVVLIFAVAFLALALHGFQREIVGATVARSFHDMFRFQAGELLRRLTEMGDPNCGYSVNSSVLVSLFKRRTGAAT